MCREEEPGWVGVWRGRLKVYVCVWREEGSCDSSFGPGQPFHALPLSQGLLTSPLYCPRQQGTDHTIPKVSSACIQTMDKVSFSNHGD